MAYNRDNIAQIRADFADRRRQAVEDSRRRKAELYARIPEVEELDAQIASVGVRAMKIAMDGGDVESGIHQMKAEHTRLRQRRGQLLTAAGYPVDYSDIHYRCETCGDTGFVGTAMCRCMRTELTLAGYESSGLGHLMANQSFATFSLDYYTGPERAAMEVNRQALLEFATHFPERRQQNWLLIGSTGLGKTHLSTAVAKTVIDGGFDVVYDSAQGIFSAFETARFGRGDGDSTATDRYFRCELLIIDDLGTELTNNFTISCLYNLINTRLNRQLATMINTNLTYQELRSRYADRITSRLFGEYRLLTFAGRDIRAQKLKK